MKRILATTCILLTFIALAGCGGGSSKTVDPEVSVMVSPGSVNLIAGQTQQFTASVSGSTNSAVKWSLTGTGCSAASCGAIDTNGLYTAPSPIPASATITVIATATGGTAATGTATVKHMPVVVSVTPGSASLISGDTKQFTAAVTNVPSGSSAGVTWTVTGGGTINGSGLYAAPAKVTVDTNITATATSQFDNTKSGSVTFLVKAAVVTVSPESITMDLGAQQRFVATVTNVPAGQTAVTWYLNGVGAVNDSGLYMSPMQVDAETTVIVQAVPLFDDTKVGKATVTLNPVVVTISPRSATFYSGQTQQFTASVINHASKTVTWTVSGSECAGAACGMIDTTGFYHAPSSITKEMSVTVKAESVADTRKSDSAVVNLIPVKITVTPKTATVSVSGAQQFSANVTGSSNTNATWSVSGTGCSGSTCGSINNSGLYTAPSVVPTPGTVTVKATAVADGTKSDTATVTITTNANIKLNGAYAFWYRGFDAAGEEVDAVGSFVADGNGHLTSGLIDINAVETSARSLKGILTGSYQMKSGNRGELVLNSFSNGAATFRFAMNSTGDQGRMIRFDVRGEYGAGEFKRQTTTDFTLSKFNGDYVLGIVGAAAEGYERDGAVGRFHTDGAGSVSDTSIDVTNTGGPAIKTTFSGSFAFDSATGSNYGRSTGTVLAVGSPQTIHLSIYFVNASEAFLMTNDTVNLDTPLMLGRVLKQTGGPFSNASLTGNSAYYLTGISPTNPKVQIGQINANGAGAATSEFARNGAGVQVVVGGAFDMTYSIASNGRGSWTAGTHFPPCVFYMASPNSGFILQSDSPGTSVYFGFFEPQTGGPFSTTSVRGEYYGGALDGAGHMVAYSVGVQIWNENGNWTGTSDLTAREGGILPDVPVFGTYSLTSGTTGAGTWAQTALIYSNKAFYLVSPNKILFIPTDATVVNPGLEILEK